MSDFTITPINQDAVPVGTLAELQAENLDPRVYASCAAPNPVTGVLGCPHYARCIVSAKGVSGPKNYGIQILKGRAHGGGMTTVGASCMWIAQNAAVYEKNEGSVRVIAEEGQTFDRVTRVAVNNDTGEIAGKYDRNVRREDRRIKVLVQPWPRPGENQEILADMLRAEMSQVERERRTDEQFARNSGLEHTIPPLDKRDAGRRGRGKEKD